DVLGDVDVAVIPEAAGLIDDEAVRIALARLDRLLRHVRDAVRLPAAGLIDTVPMDGMAHRREVVHDDLELVPFDDVNQRTRHLAVERPDLCVEAGRHLYLDLLDRHLELAKLGGGPCGEAEQRERGGYSCQVSRHFPSSYRGPLQQSSRR